MPKKQVTYGEEHLVELIPQADAVKQKSKIYISKHRPEIVKFTKEVRKENKTLGPLITSLEPPANYLKKSDRKLDDPSDAPKNGECSRFNPSVRKDKLPDAHGIIPEHTNTDFIKKNAIENITSIPCKPKNIACDTRAGNKNLMENSGLCLKYSLKKDYGKVPEYVVHKKIAAQQQQDAYNAYMAEVVKSKSLDQISDDERALTLGALKEKWTNIHEEFQGLSVVTDTLSKKHRKERLEGEMLGIENDIKVLERHNTIFLTKQILY